MCMYMYVYVCMYVYIHTYYNQNLARKFDKSFALSLYTSIKNLFYVFENATERVSQRPCVLPSHSFEYIYTHTQVIQNEAT